MKLIARTSFHQTIVILQRCTHSMPMKKKVKVKKCGGQNGHMAGTLWVIYWPLEIFLKAFNLQKFHSIFL